MALSWGSGRSVTGIGALLALLAIGGAAHSGGAGPSFDCARVSEPAEEMICQVPELARMDLLVSKLFRSFTPEFGDKREIARGLLLARNECASDVTCIASIEADMLTTYGDLPEWASRYVSELFAQRAQETAAEAGEGTDEPVPVIMGSCAVTRIEALGTRFSEELPEEDNGEGSRVQFTNGGGLVSYEHEAELVASEPGDTVVMCLMSVPRDCPDGDDRGRSYYTLNTRTQGSWTLGDSQHMCGGA